VDLTKREALGELAEDMPAQSVALYLGGASAVLFNAVFGNLYDQRAALEKATGLLREDGLIILSHPLGRSTPSLRIRVSLPKKVVTMPTSFFHLGRGFLRRLHEKDPIRVPHLLPDAAMLTSLTRFLPLDLEYCEGLTSEEDPFIVVLRRRPVAVMERPLFLRGKVASGFGRGSKKLGFPTANLPSSEFANHLEDLPVGVYCGWAVVEYSPGETDRTVYPMVANIGYSPTFEGQENTEKIVEAYLIGYNPRAASVEEMSAGDFYGKPLRLLITGRQRPELKFDGFLELRARIATDVEDAAHASEAIEPIRALKDHPLLRCAEEDLPLFVGVDQVSQDCCWREDFLDVFLMEAESRAE